jgi:hypothetical protein
MSDHTRNSARIVAGSLEDTSTGSTSTRPERVEELLRPLLVRLPARLRLGAPEPDRRDATRLCVPQRGRRGR